MIQLMFFVIFSIILLLFTVRLLVKLSQRRCESTKAMIGKLIIITGANNGLGYHAAVDLAKRGGKVILACRSEERALIARDNIIRETGNKNVVYKYLNLSSLKSVREFAEDIKKSEPRLDVLINNAGVSTLNHRLTEDGIVECMQINYHAPFLLTILLLPMLKKVQGRVVNLNSVCHFRGEVNFIKINKASAYSESLTYANSKLCNLIFTKELARRLEGTGVTVNALHPGVILTNIVPSEAPLITRISFAFWCWLSCRSPEEGAQTIIYLSVAEEVNAVTGKYFVDCQPYFTLWTSNDRKLAELLWKYTENLVDLREEEKKILE